MRARSQYSPPCAWLSDSFVMLPRKRGIEYTQRGVQFNLFSNTKSIVGYVGDTLLMTAVSEQCARPAHDKNNRPAKVCLLHTRGSRKQADGTKVECLDNASPDIAAMLRKVYNLRKCREANICYFVAQYDACERFCCNVAFSACMTMFRTFMVLRNCLVTIGMFYRTYVESCCLEGLRSMHHKIGGGILDISPPVMIG